MNETITGRDIAFIREYRERRSAGRRNGKIKEAMEEARCYVIEGLVGARLWVGRAEGSAALARIETVRDPDGNVCSECSYVYDSGDPAGKLIVRWKDGSSLEIVDVEWVPAEPEKGSESEYDMGSLEEDFIRFMNGIGVIAD